MLKIKYFTLGAIGSLISAISIGLIFIIDLLPILLHLYLYTIYSKIPLLLTTFFLGVGILLASFSYREIKNNYGLLFGKIGFVFGIISSVLFFFTAIVAFLTPEFMILIYPPPLIFQINSMMHLLNGVFFGLTLIVWGITHFKVHNLCRKPILSFITSGFFVSSGFVILSIFYSDFGFALSSIGLLFASFVFWTFKLNT